MCWTTGLLKSYERHFITLLFVSLKDCIVQLLSALFGSMIYRLLTY